MSEDEVRNARNDGYEGIPISVEIPDTPQGKMPNYYLRLIPPLPCDLLRRNIALRIESVRVKKEAQSHDGSPPGGVVGDAGIVLSAANKNLVTYPPLTPGAAD
jgi:hypothetical protein